MLFDFLDTGWQRSHRAPVTDDDFKIWVMCHYVRADLDVTKSDHNWDTTLTQPRKDDHQKRDTDVWMIHSGVFHIEDHILLDWQRSTRALFMFCSLKRGTFGLMGDWGEMKGPKQKNTEMFEEEEDF